MKSNTKVSLNEEKGKGTNKKYHHADDEYASDSPTEDDMVCHNHSLFYFIDC